MKYNEIYNYLIKTITNNYFCEQKSYSSNVYHKTCFHLNDKSISRKWNQTIVPDNIFF